MSVGNNEGPHEERPRPPSRPPPQGDALFLSEPRLRTLIAAVLRRKVHSNDLDDAVQNTLEQLTLWCREEGAEKEASVTAGAHQITRNIALSWGRDAGRRSKVITGTTDAADEHAREPAPGALEPLDVKRSLMDLNPGASPPREKALTLLMLLAAGNTYEEIAQETGQSELALRKSAERARKSEASRLRARGRHDIGIRNLLLAAGCIAVVVVFVVPRERWRVLGETIAAWIWPPKPLDSTPKEVSPGPKVEREVDRRIEDAEDALRTGDITRCNRDTQAARFLGGGDPVRLGEVTRRCLEASERNMDPASSASAPMPRAPGPAPRPRGAVPDPDLRSLNPLQ